MEKVGESYTKNEQDLKGLRELMPNLREIHLKDTSDDGEFLSLYADKFLELSLSTDDLDELEGCKFPNLKHLDLRAWQDYDFELNQNHINMFPSLKAINLTAHYLLNNFCEYFTEITLEEGNAHLKDLHMFKNLKKLDVDLLLEDSGNHCFYSHKLVGQCVALESLKIYASGNALCPQCFDNLVQELPNLKRLTYSKSYDLEPNYLKKRGNCIDSIFKHLSKLETLKISAPDNLTLKASWPVMENLEILSLDLKSIKANERDWVSFSKKLTRVKDLKVSAKTYLNLEDILKNNIPQLQKLTVPKVSDYERRKEEEEQEEARQMRKEYYREMGFGYGGYY